LRTGGRIGRLRSGRFLDARGAVAYAAAAMRALPVLAVLCAFAARAQNSVKDPGAPFPTFVDLSRASAMGGAGAAIATGNEALTINPAGLSQVRRYHLEIDGVYDAKFPAQGLMVSIADSTSSSIATGLLFSRWGSGQPQDLGGGRGEGWYAGLGYSYAIGSYSIGGMTKYLRFATPDGDAHQFAQDVGVITRRGQFSYAAVVQNVSTSSIPLFPITATAAVAYGTDTDWHLALDYKADLSDLKNVKSRAAAGLEILLEQALVVRGGVTWDASSERWWASAGAGILTEKGGVQFVWRRRVAGGGFDQFFEGAITLYLE
jgi:hypothetical protein